MYVENNLLFQIDSKGFICGYSTCRFHQDSKNYRQIAGDSKDLLFQIDSKGFLCGLLYVSPPGQQKISRVIGRQQGLTFLYRQLGIPVWVVQRVGSRIAKDIKSYSQIARYSNYLLFQIDSKGFICGYSTCRLQDSKNYRQIARDSKDLLFQIDSQGFLCGLFNVSAPGLAVVVMHLNKK